MSMRVFERAIEKTKESGGRDIYFYTIPSGFKNNNELLEYFASMGCFAEIIDSDDAFGILHINRTLSLLWSFLQWQKDNCFSPLYTEIFVQSIK